MQLRVCCVSPRAPAARISQVWHCCSWFLHNPSRPPRSLLSVPLCSLLRLQLSPVKSLKGVRFSHCTPVISISNPLRLCLGSHHWYRAMSTHPQNNCICSQILPGYLRKRGTTGAYGSIVPFFFSFFIISGLQSVFVMRINNKWIWFLNKKLKFATVFFHIISSYPSICYCLFGSRCQQSNPRCHCYPFPNHQPPPALLRGHQGFPMQGKRNNLAGSVPGCLSDMPKPPQLAHFNAEEQQLYAKPPSEWLSSSPYI